VLCSYYVTALSKFALLRYLSEIRFQVLTAIYPRFTHESGTIRKKQAIDVSKLKRLLCYESQHQSQSNEKSLVQFDYEKAVSNCLGTQSTFKKYEIRSDQKNTVSTWSCLVRVATMESQAASADLALPSMSKCEQRLSSASSGEEEPPST